MPPTWELASIANCPSIRDAKRPGSMYEIGHWASLSFWRRYSFWYRRTSLWSRNDILHAAPSCSSKASEPTWTRFYPSRLSPIHSHYSFSSHPRIQRINVRWIVSTVPWTTQSNSASITYARNSGKCTCHSQQFGIPEVYGTYVLVRRGQDWRRAQRGRCSFPRTFVFISLECIQEFPNTNSLQVPPPFLSLKYFSREPMQPALVIHGQVVRSYNDGSYYIERRSTRRPTDWVSQDSYPRASLEVYATLPLCCCVELMLCASANARDIPGRNLFKPRNSVKYSPLDTIDMSTTSGRKRIERYLFRPLLFANRIRSTWSAYIMIEYMSSPLNFPRHIFSGFKMTGSLGGNVWSWGDHRHSILVNQNPEKKHVVWFLLLCNASWNKTWDSCCKF